MLSLVKEEPLACRITRPFNKKIGCLKALAILLGDFNSGEFLGDRGNKIFEEKFRTSFSRRLSNRTNHKARLLNRLVYIKISVTRSGVLLGQLTLLLMANHSRHLVTWIIMVIGR